MAIIANLYIDQGTDYEVTIDCTDDAGEVLDLTGYTAGCTNKKNLWFFYIAGYIYNHYLCSFRSGYFRFI